MPLHIVIDTNVCLDLFAFRDARWNLILEGLRNGSIRTNTRFDCREEWLAVLDYPHLPVNETNRGEIVARFDQFIPVVDFPARPERLPVCTDKDDQKFLEHARDSQAQVLVSKDKALLKLGRKTRALGLFAIETPELFLRRLVANPQGL
ncbi:putative toxin-antitoxin system toxin component, PIN family [Undibacterium cyanobacteriorum]|uniref:Toxin-antitoxin system toxin component, PIN family n=1 Tax=Undibacterium cyanobacteriorum TaxID=3073561 RepID=A0ABY9RFQ7_9BURK|nr:putative toxin-antitoxin system toxin component, PIN family [Undibacterium sp. 20NA77.5]WMW78971.1 putative toxin-antitoxin system toxin component, PIN family [Undibacterium sp. 20NA77.5]